MYMHFKSKIMLQVVRGYICMSDDQSGLGGDRLRRWYLLGGLSGTVGQVPLHLQSAAFYFCGVVTITRKYIDLVFLSLFLAHGS